jgi:hypothetical protein
MTMGKPMPSMGAILDPTVVHTADVDGNMRRTFAVEHAPALGLGTSTSWFTTTQHQDRDPRPGPCPRRHPVSLG